MMNLPLVLRSHIAPKVPVSYGIWMELAALDDGSEMADIERIVSRDPGLVVKIMAVANSAFFGRSEAIGSLEEALMHLGSTEIVRLAGMLAFRDTTDEGLPLYGMSQRDFSRHSIYTAVLMGGMAAKGGLSPSMAYTLGLIRGLGHWFIQEALRSHNMGVRPYTGPLGEANLWEEDKLQINHAEFAANTLRQFRLSGDLLNTLAYYLRPHAAGNMAGATLLLHCTEQAVRDILPSRQMDPSILPGDWYLHYAPEKEFRALQIRGQQMLQSLG